MRKKLKFLIGGIAVAAMVAYLAISASREGMVYYLTVSELIGKAGTLDDRGVRVSGTVVKGSIKRDAGTLDMEFVITDGKAQLPVSYHGVVPDIFGDDINVVIEGRYLPEGLFKANTLLAKCPSKFEGKVENKM